MKNKNIIILLTIFALLCCGIIFIKFVILPKTDNKTTLGNENNVESSGSTDLETCEHIVKEKIIEIQSMSDKNISLWDELSLNGEYEQAQEDMLDKIKEENMFTDRCLENSLPFDLEDNYSIWYVHKIKTELSKNIKDVSVPLYAYAYNPDWFYVESFTDNEDPTYYVVTIGRIITKEILSSEEKYYFELDLYFTKDNDNKFKIDKVKVPFQAKPYNEEEGVN